jgi:PAS domain S-box-containing protein
MSAPEKTREQLFEELHALHGRVAQLSRAEEDCRRAEEALKKQTLVLHSVLGCMGDGVVVADLQGRALVCNPAVGQVLGIDPGVYPPAGWGTSGLFYLPDRVTPCPPDTFPLARGLRGETVDEVELFLRHPPGGEGRWLSLYAQPLRDEQGGTAGAVLVLRDVTRRRLKEEELRESQERFRLFMDNNPAVAFLKDERGRFLYYNRTHQLFFQHGSDDWLGKTVFDVYPPEVASRLQEHDDKVLAAGRLLQTQEVVPAPDGSPHHWLVFKFPVRDVAGHTYLGGVAINVTERLRAEEQSHEYAQRLQSLSRRMLEVQEQERRHLAVELHDEVGQVLTGLKLTLEASRHLPVDQFPDCLATAQALLSELTTRVRDLSLRLRPTMLDDLGLLSALLWLFERYTALTGVQVRFEHRGLEGRFHPDVETGAYRIVQEAVTNVARHTHVAEVAVRIWLDQDLLCIRIEDRGNGFDAGPPPAGAASTGLSGMQERAVLLGGRLTIESLPGVGTHLTAQLPVHGPGPESQAGPDPRLPVPRL